MDPVIPPLHFGSIGPNAYRGSYPRPRNISFLERLGLKTILSLTPQPLEDEPIFKEFAKDNHMKLIHLPPTQKNPEVIEISNPLEYETSAASYTATIQDDTEKTKKKKKKKTKKSGSGLSYSYVVEALSIIINNDNLPIYIHCINGQEITGLIVACLRKLSFWSTASIFAEFLIYAGNLIPADHQFVTAFKAQISLPPNPAPWIWKGLSRQGVVEHHPSLKITHNEQEQSKE